MKEIEQDVLVMKKGKLMRVRQGEMLPVDLVVPLSNGARVAMDGTLTLPDGTTRLLMDGEAINMDGEMTTLADIRGEGDDLSDEMEA